MFGIGGGELIFVLFIVLMLFGSDKIPDLARTLGKGMAQLKSATNDIKGEIHKSVQENGLDKSIIDIRGTINAEINKAKENLLGDTPQQFNFIKNDLVADANNIINPIQESVATENTNTSIISEQAVKSAEEAEESTGPIKRQS